MHPFPESVFGLSRPQKTTILLLMSVVFFMLCDGTISAIAQKRYSKTYPAGQSVRLELTNRSGTVTVEGWDRPEVSITASLEAPAAVVLPQSLSGRIVINLLKDNAGRGDIGNVNFTIRVPYYTAVSIETLMGNLSVSNIRSTLVRAHISTEGDITLTNISATGVSAENVTGDIFFDGEIQSGGYYRFTSMKGAINIRIPFQSGFKLMATAPSTRSINLGEFNGGQMRALGDGRRIIGQNGDGGASIQVTNQRGTISFLPR
jgi:DUF4097 and DUF4098 domain-containing protein YvlB